MAMESSAMVFFTFGVIKIWSCLNSNTLIIMILDCINTFFFSILLNTIIYMSDQIRLSVHEGVSRGKCSGFFPLCATEINSCV